MSGPGGNHPGRPVPRVLSIAGTDPTGGAGIPADLKAIAALGGYGMAVVTALVAQNTEGVRSVHRPPVAFLREQLDAVSDDVAIDAVKLGMLVDAEVIGEVADWLAAAAPPVVVLDPVMVATSGDRLLDAAAEQAMRDLLPRADLVTPNVPELAVLLDEEPAADWAGVLDQAVRLAARTGVRVLAKGGHLDGADLPDALVGPDGVEAEVTGERVVTRNTHGTGCSMSSALATLRGRGRKWPEAVREAKAWLTQSLRAADALEVGRGHGPVSHLAGLWERAGVHAPSGPEITAAWWEEIAGIRADIDAGAFVTRLGDGTLEEPAFRGYLAQDALYLREYSRALAAASTLAPTAAEQSFWAGAAREAIDTELALHGTWVGEEDLFAAEPSPTTRAYVDHLLALAARGDYAALIAGVLPCFWIYEDVGRRLAARARPGHPYETWLGTYADEAFAEATRRAIVLVGEHATGVDGPTRERMRDAFVVSARHEEWFFAAPLA